jgi:hypothetical protein
MRDCKCGNTVAKNAKFCPKCGHRFTSLSTTIVAWMFGIFGIFVILMMSLAHGAPDSSHPNLTSASTAPSPIKSAQPAAKPKTAAQIAAGQIASRKAYAKVIDEQLLEMGIESKTFTQGAQAKTIVIQDALCGRVRANSLGKNSTMFDQLKALGFARLHYTNGFEGDLHEGFSWDLTK